MEVNDRIEDINTLILEIANGNFNHSLEISDSFDEIDAIVSGINMLGEELKASVIAKNYLNSIFEGIVDMLIIFDKHFSIKEVNSKVGELLGFHQEDLISQNIAFLFPSEEKETLELMKNQLAYQGFLYNQESSFRHHSGHTVPVSASLSLLKDNDNKVQGYVLVAKDLKQVLLTADALKQKNSELQTLVYKVSHDLKGPVASVMGLLDLAEMAGDDLVTVQNYLTHIKNSLGKLNHTIVNLFEYSLSTQPSFELNTFFIKPLLEEIINSYASSPAASSIKVKVDVAADLYITSGKKFVISIFQHIIENAYTFKGNAQKNSYLKISALQKEKNLLFYFEDNGCGMDANVLSRAFDMFYRGHSASKGSGLGLFIVKSNVEKLGGDISISSEVSVGTKITILLPSLTGNTISIS
ncbi:PAS domain-containing sensor histidine kinase [Porifericola rhodea]|uniref:PAS domain-containing sensor histidine kinase n=1 Tax=Porifericola rhodea TaxID=930972 RepID=UPI0026652806|nr:PAS domain-containing sensor histidine kinase [Porifericola rhodea]WKN30612.1 PAS domain-containing sensor histidine kinase [Porifericola rhodea]